MEEERYKPLYSIGEAAKILGVVVPFLRILEKTDLILTARNEHGKRLYSQCDMEYIKAILELGKKQRRSIEEIHASIAGFRCWEILECSQEQRQKCPKFMNIDQLCWIRNDIACSESVDKCRSCQVYRSLAQRLQSQYKLKQIMG